MPRSLRWILILFVALPIGYLIWSGYAVYRYQANRKQSRTNLKQIGLALQSTWENVQPRLKSTTLPELLEHLRGVDQLQIPNLSIGVLRRFTELESLPIPTKASPDRHIVDAKQTIQFRLDEYGAELISDMHMIVGENGHSEPKTNRLDPRRLVFDKPFLLVLRQHNAYVPYFLAWIGNTDLMEAAD